MRRFWSHRSQTHSDVLPTPAVASAPKVGGILPESASDAPGKKKLTRLNVSTLKIWWDALKERLGTGSALSESLLENILETEYESSHIPKARGLDEKADGGPESPIDEVVVDNLMSSDGATHKSPTDPAGTGGSPDKALADGHPEASSIRAESLNGGDMPAPISWAHFAWTIARWRIFPMIHGFFVCKFHDEKMEAQFRREAWFTNKRLALWASLFYVLNWVIGCVLLPKPHPIIEVVFYWGLAPVLTLPLPFLVAWDFPRRHSLFYQIFLACSTWSWPIYQCLFLILCGLYGQHQYFGCGNRDFLGLLYYASALPAIALFGLGLQRLPSMAPTIIVLIIMAVGIVPFRHTWSRSVVNIFVSQMFYLWLHYLRENTDRRLYSMREQLKIQFRATQKAQVNERKASDSKRRLTSYIFHEVRVPLNTALLAVQNMGAHGSIPKGQDIEFAALEGSLSMMSKVLNDVLDFNRMDSGRLESVNRPYPFHTALRSMLVPLKLAADARGLLLETEIDKRIDEVARRAWYRAQEEATPAWVEARMAENPDEEGIVLGDEMRLRQIVTNLASNACKFTPSGGKISVRTTLICPVLSDATPATASQDEKSTSAHEISGLSTHRLSQHNFSFASLVDNIVVRIEIEDTGPGIRVQDLADNKLFSPYVQTEIGRTQGGKGTGLGLALVRHIVKLSKGRLGVRSQLGVGSTFWVELRLGVGKKALPRGNGSDSVKAYYLDSQKQNCKRERVEIRPVTGDGAPVTPMTEQSSRMENGMASEGFAGLIQLFPPHTVSALKSIMDQGGLVELSPRHSGLADCSMLSLNSPLGGPPPTDDNSSPLSPPASTSNLGQKSSARPTFISLPGQDSSYFFQSPHVPSSSVIQRALTQSSSSPDPSLHFESPLHALVVDDDFITRQLMSRLLTRLGVSVTCAENGAVALDLILGNTSPAISNDKTPTGVANWTSQADQPRFDIIFLDNQMPVMSGLEVVRQLRERGRSDFVVGVTGNALLCDQDEYVEAGVNKVLTKPVHERNLKSALNAADQLRKLRPTPMSEQDSSSAPQAPDKNCA